MQTGASTEGERALNDLSISRWTPASLASRLAAFAVDCAIVSAAAFLGVRAFPSAASTDEFSQLIDLAGASGAVNPDDFANGLLVVAYAGIWLLVAQTYFILAEWRFGRTVGKKFFGIRVVRETDAGRPGFWATAVRDSMRWIWDAHIGAVLALPMMAPQFGGRRIGDRITGLRVVKSP